MTLRKRPLKDDRDKPEKQKINLIHAWNGKAKTGKWIPEAIMTSVKRTFERHTHGATSTRAKPVIVRETVEEFIHMHGGYRPEFDGEKKTRKAFFFRGARVWRKA